MSPTKVLLPAGLVASGLAFGVLAVLASGIDGAAGQVIEVLLVSGWTWAALPYCLGVLCDHPRTAVLFPTAFLISAVISYYVTQLWRGDFMIADVTVPGGAVRVFWYGFWSMLAAWSLAACVTGPLLGLAGYLGRRRGLPNLVFRLVVPFLAVAETSLRLSAAAPLQDPVVTYTWTVVRIVAVAVAVVLVGQTGRHLLQDTRRGLQVQPPR